MSCDTQSKRVGRCAGARAGINAVAGKFSHSVGSMADRAVAEMSKNKVPIAMAGLALGGMGALAAGAVVAPEPLKQQAKQRAAAAGQRVSEAAGTARQSAGATTATVRDAATAAREGVISAAGTTRQAVGAAVSSARGAAEDAVGAYAEQVDRVSDALGSQAAPVADRLVGLSNSKAAGVAVGIGKRMVLSRNPALIPVMISAQIAAKVSSAATGGIATRVAHVSRSNLAGSVVQDRRRFLFFKGKEAVNLWKSSLTDRLNRADLLGSHRLGRGVYASDGVMFETRGGRTWHRGTSVISTSAGQRTITHLQSLARPGQHYYFKSRLGDEQAVGIATGRVDPKQMPGYVGQVSAGEMLCPGWAGAKHATIKAALYWGDKGR
jgi:hypothetical protein